MKQEELEFYMDAYGKDLFSFCCCVTRNRQEADDLYQDTFLKVYELGEKLVITTNPKSYLMGIALNQFRSFIQRYADARNPLSHREVMIVREECRIVREAVRKLPDKYRIPILLFYMEELSQAEIAALLRISESAVKTRVHRAKKLLKEKLEGLL